MTKEIQKFAYMTPRHIQDISIQLWGEDKWREHFQNAFDLSYSQLHRYMSVYKGQLIPKSIALALDMMVTLRANDIDLPDLADYLTPVAKVEPLIFKPEKKAKVPREINDAPIADFFDLGTAAPAETSPEPEPAKTEPNPEPAKTKPKPTTKPKAKPDGKVSRNKKTPTEMARRAKASAAKAKA